MSKVRVAGFGLSLDGFSAGIEQSLSDPLGSRGRFADRHRDCWSLVRMRSTNGSGVEKGNRKRSTS